MNVADQSWIGALPHGWECTALRWVFSERKEINKLRDVTNILSVTNDRGVIRYADKGDIGNKASDDIERYKKVLKGDIVANSMNVIIGSVGIAPEDGVLSPVYIVMEPSSAVDVRYFDYIFKTKLFQSQLKRIGYGILDHRMRIPWYNLKVQVMPKPPLQSQKRIADYLDEETAKIDMLIERQGRLLELLEEKRRATINNAVTAGLNEKSYTMSVGLPWISSIPKHWQIMRLKDLFSANDEALSNKTKPEYEFDYVDISSVDKYRGIIKRERMNYENSPSRARRIVRKGDIIIGAVRTYLEAIAQISDADDLIVSTGFVVLRPKEVADSDYYFYALRSGPFMANVVANSVGVSYPAINSDTLMALHIPVPPKEERLEIANHCRDEMKKMDLLKSSIYKELNLLKERRNSLISNVVTGKVKV